MHMHLMCIDYYGEEYYNVLLENQFLNISSN